MRMREARTKFIHQLSCGAAFHFSQIHRDTPPVRIMNSPLCAVGCGSAARTDTGAAQKSKQAKRIKQMERMAGRKMPNFGRMTKGNRVRNGEESTKDTKKHERENQRALGWPSASFIRFHSRFKRTSQSRQGR